MTTKDKVLLMMHKAAAARSLNDKIMAKRAEYAKCANEPSDAYLEGFSKAAEYYGVDPVALVKEALSGAQMNMIANTTSLAAKGTAQVARGAKNVATAAGRGAKSIANAAGRGATLLGEGLVGGAAKAIPVVARNLGQFVGAVRRGLGYNAARGRVPFRPKGSSLFGSKAKNPFGKATELNGKGKPGDFADALRKSRAEATADPTSEALGLDSRFNQGRFNQYLRDAIGDGSGRSLMDFWRARGQELRNLASQLGIQ